MENLIFVVLNLSSDSLSFCVSEFLVEKIVWIEWYKSMNFSTNWKAVKVLAGCVSQSWFFEVIFKT